MPQISRLRLFTFDDSTSPICSPTLSSSRKDRERQQLSLGVEEAEQRDRYHQRDDPSLIGNRNQVVLLLIIVVSLFTVGLASPEIETTTTISLVNVGSILPFCHLWQSWQVALFLVLVVTCWVFVVLLLSCHHHIFLFLTAGLFPL